MSAGRAFKPDLKPFAKTNTVIVMVAGGPHVHLGYHGHLLLFLSFTLDALHLKLTGIGCVGLRKLGWLIAFFLKFFQKSFQSGIRLLLLGIPIMNASKDVNIVSDGDHANNADHFLNLPGFFLLYCV